MYIIFNSLLIVVVVVYKSDMMLYSHFVNVLMTWENRNGFATHLSSEAQQRIRTVVNDATMSVWFDERIATRNVFATSMLELVLHIARIAVVHGIVELILRRAGDQLIRMANNDARLSNCSCSAQNQSDGLRIGNTYILFNILYQWAIKFKPHTTMFMVLPVEFELQVSTANSKAEI